MGGAGQLLPRGVVDLGGVEVALRVDDANFGVGFPVEDRRFVASPTGFK